MWRCCFRRRSGWLSGLLRLLCWLLLFFTLFLGLGLDLCGGNRLGGSLDWRSRVGLSSRLCLLTIGFGWRCFALLWSRCFSLLGGSGGCRFFVSCWLWSGRVSLCIFLFRCGLLLLLWSSRSRCILVHGRWLGLFSRLLLFNLSLLSGALFLRCLFLGQTQIFSSFSHLGCHNWHWFGLCFGFWRWLCISFWCWF